MAERARRLTARSRRVWRKTDPLARRKRWGQRASPSRHGAGFVAPENWNHGFTDLRLQVSQNGVGMGVRAPAKAQRIAMELPRTKIVRPARASSCHGWSCSRACDGTVVAPGRERRLPPRTQYGGRRVFRRFNKVTVIEPVQLDRVAQNLARGSLLGRRHRLHLFEQVGRYQCVFGSLVHLHDRVERNLAYNCNAIIADFYANPWLTPRPPSI